jgi:hypothetical protein
MHPYITESHDVKYAGSITSAYAIDTISSCVLVSTIITNKFFGEGFCLGQTSINGYEAMGFDVTQLTPDEVQKLFTRKTDKSIHMLVYGDSFQWAKYGHHILPPNIDLRSLNKGSLHRTFCNSLISAQISMEIYLPP